MGAFDTDGRGNVILHPLTGFHAVTGMEMLAILRLEFLLPPNGKREGSLQVSMNAPQAREVAMALLKMAAQLEQPPPSRPVN